jgi:hypothetical protein
MKNTVIPIGILLQRFFQPGKPLKLPPRFFALDIDSVQGFRDAEKWNLRRIRREAIIFSAERG